MKTKKQYEKLMKIMYLWRFLGGKCEIFTYILDNNKIYNTKLLNNKNSTKKTVY